METVEMYNSIDLNIKQSILGKKVQHAPKIKSAYVNVSFCRIQKESESAEDSNLVGKRFLFPEFCDVTIMDILE